MPLDLKTIDKQKVGFFRFKQLNGKYLITNDIGDYCFLDPSAFQDFLNGKIEQACPDKYSELQTKGFIHNRMNFDDLSQRYAKKNAFLGQCPSLHIVIVTLRCDHRCSYCQAGSQGLDAKGLDMDISTAQKVVDRILESPNKNITIEFQGGEPLTNWDTVKFIVEYASQRNKVADKTLLISLVSNFTFMTKERLGFFIRNNVGFCASLDGPEKLHNKNRITAGKNNSYKNTIKWLKIIKNEIRKNKKYKYRVNALTTVTKYSFSYPEQIIDEYLKLGIQGIHLRPVNPFGINKKIWQKISFLPEDFINFYKTALDYIINLNLKGKNFYERTAKIFLAKILADKDPNFLDIRSPCGAGIGQLAYNFNGDVYTCDEGRMLSRLRDESFKIGNVCQNSCRDFIDNEITKTLCLASCLDNLAKCSECIYKPYCGVCPVYNYTQQHGNIFTPMPNNEKCKINMAIFDYLFEKLKDKRIEEIFKSWIGLR